MCNCHSLLRYAALHGGHGEEVWKDTEFTVRSGCSPQRQRISFAAKVR